MARLKASQDHWEEVDAHQIVLEILNDIGKIVNLDEYTIQINPLPKLYANRDQIIILFTHLIENALKFHKANSIKKTMHLSAVQKGNQWQFTLTDNGIGIHDGQDDNVFTMFKKLQPENYSGIGSGLTIAKKIVRIHGGQIWIDRNCKEGTTLSFLLPSI